eukprot:215261-Pelagomonas_calceolata.AAC.6
MAAAADASSTAGGPAKAAAEMLLLQGQHPQLAASGGSGAIGHLEVTPLAEQGRASSGCLESSSSSSSSSEGSDEEYDPSSSRFKSKSKVTAAGRPGIHKVKRAQPRGALAGTQQGCTPAISVQATARQSKAPMKSGAKMPWPQQASAADEGAPLLVPPNKEPVAKKRPAKASYGVSTPSLHYNS